MVFKADSSPSLNESEQADKEEIFIKANWKNVDILDLSELQGKTLKPVQLKDSNRFEGAE